MKLEMQGQMRLEQKMKLAPHMIQAMEILQLPKLELLERVEQELNSNPVLEREQSETEAESTQDSQETAAEPETDNVEDFGKLDNLDEGYREFFDESEGAVRKPAGDGDKKLEALKNTAEGTQSIYDYLEQQWRMVEAEPEVKKAGEKIIDYIDERGYLTVRLEQFHSKEQNDLKLEHFQKALELIQQLEPAGVGARDLKE
jgi:RNA polymerase sigma-54 factor